MRLSADQGLRVTNLVRDPEFVELHDLGALRGAADVPATGAPGLALEVRVVDFEPARSIIITRDITQRERVDAVRRDFIANVSHELRTPLTVVTGFLEMLLDRGPRMTRDAPASPRPDARAGPAHDAAGRGPADAVATRVTRERRARTMWSIVRQLVREVGDEARALSSGRHRISIDAPPAFVRGSRDELRSAFGNLVSNAIRYTPEGGQISLRWIEADGEGRFEVEDTGIGIAAEHLSRLTERFYRVDKSRSRETGGTGLGLAIVKHILLRHAGRLEIASEIGQGQHLQRSAAGERLIPVAGPTKPDPRLEQAA